MARDYTGLITSAFKVQPKFVAVVDALTKPFGQIGDVAINLPVAFSIDTGIGAQLDVIGLWVGISRRQAVPIPNSFFSWNTAGLGWNEANWKGPYTPTEGIVDLDDETYRAVLKAKIGSNYWDGSNAQLNQIGQAALADLGVTVFALDNLDMTSTVYILGAPTKVLIELIKRGVAPPKTAGIGITGYILASSPGAPFFALSVTTTSLVGGLDFGSFGDPV